MKQEKAGKSSDEPPSGLLTNILDKKLNFERTIKSRFKIGFFCFLR